MGEGGVEKFRLGTHQKNKEPKTDSSVYYIRDHALLLIPQKL